MSGVSAIIRSPRLNGGADSAVAEPADVPASAGRGHRMLYLAGRPSLRSFVRYVRHRAAAELPDHEIAAQWKRASAIVKELQRDEAGRADGASTIPLGPEYEPFLLELFQDPLIRNGFNTVPTDIALVELDKLVVYQKHIDIPFAQQRASRLGPIPDAAAVFRTCLPHDHPSPPVAWSRVHGNTFVFVSPSNDLRSLGSVRLDPSQVDAARFSGSVVGVAGVAIGFGSNFLNAVACEGRIILNNGSHRAYALRQIGVTHVPCIVQHVSSREELRLVADGTVSDDADFYLRDARPPMLVDYFDPRLHVVLDSKPRLTQIRVSVQVDESWLPAL
jgi:hypothetical protein